MVTTTWTIHTKRNGDHTADALTADWPTVRRGGNATLRLWFDNADADKTLLVEDGESFTVANGETVTRQRAIDEGSGTITVNDGGTLTLDESGYYQLLQYLDHANAAAYGLSVSNRPWYRDQLPGGGVGSLVLGFEPAGDIRERSVTGLWGLVTGGGDGRNSALTNWQLELEVFVLAEFGEYADHSEIEADLQA